MNKKAQILLALIVGICPLAILISGCGEKNATDNKKARLIATENMELKKQLSQREQEAEKQSKILDQCLQDKDELKNQSRSDIENLLGSALAGTDQDSAKLREENKLLKSQIEQLKKELEALQSTNP